ncbi:hypothetical protein DP73_04665 [Desulfosporosinus sp. HMP52]|nr:hypothetical protein DP73_04665 [Desulfosporosinus sp. HMP52]
MLTERTIHRKANAVVGVGLAGSTRSVGSHIHGEAAGQNEFLARKHIYTHRGGKVCNKIGRDSN